MTKPSLPQGTRDFAAATVHKRNYILSTIRKVFELYGFEPLETPAMENLDTLIGKYGEEGDKLIFKILNNGLNDPKNIDKAKQGFDKLMEGKNTSQLTERALKYDLTIPFARYVAMHVHTLTMPYKRYQIQPVWRADRPQRGRYREFTQCDADIVGSTSLLNEIDLCSLYHTCFTKLGLATYSIKINSRKIIAALAEMAGGATYITDIAIAIDKLDKIGIDKVKEALLTTGITSTGLTVIEQYLSISGTIQQKIIAIQALLQHSKIGNEGIQELQFIIANTSAYNVAIDFTLARGLNYYTGLIFEAKAPAQVIMGSIGGGGRYDNLTGMFGVPNIAGVGISFGIDRIYDVMEELQLFPQQLVTPIKAIFFNHGEAEALIALQQINKLRQANIACELYTDNVKIDKQYKYADKKQIPYAVIISSAEIANNQCKIKNLKDGTQINLPIAELTQFFTNN